MNIKLFDTFAGIGATHKALKETGANVELVGYSENNIYADISYRSIHKVDKSLNYGDISELNPNSIPDFDLMNFSFPCKDFSVAGKMSGLNDSKGITHSGLYFHGMNIIKTKKPKYVIVENVKGITFKKFEKDFGLIRKDFIENNYNIYWKILNASDYNHPQNRERLIMVCIRKDVDYNKFKFPEKLKLQYSLKDIIEKSVNDKYYKKDVYIKQFSKKSEGLMVHKAVVMVKVRKYEVDIELLKSTLREAKKNSKLTNKQVSEITGKPLTLVEHWFRNDVSFSIPSEDIWFKLKKLLKIDTNAFDHSIMTFEIREGVFDKSKRVYDIKGIAPTLTATSPNEKIYLEDGRIRELTPLECWRLMGFSDDEYISARNGIIQECMGIDNSKLEAELYERAGRSIPINILKEVFNSLLSK